MAAQGQQRRENLLVGEVARGPEQDQRVRRAVVHATRPQPITASERVGVRPSRTPSGNRAAASGVAAADHHIVDFEGGLSRVTTSAT